MKQNIKHGKFKFRNYSVVKVLSNLENQSHNLNAKKKDDSLKYN